jgi:four helix bundle protein
METGSEHIDSRLFEHPLEQRCHDFERRVRVFCRKVEWDLVNQADIRQLVRSSGSVGANYIEANEKLGEGDLRHRIKIARKEAKESIHWLGLLNTGNNEELNRARMALIDECFQLKKILSAILKNLG